MVENQPDPEEDMSTQDVNRTQIDSQAGISTDGLAAEYGIE